MIVVSDDVLPMVGWRAMIEGCLTSSAQRYGIRVNGLRGCDADDGEEKRDGSECTHVERVSGWTEAQLAL